MQSPEVLNALQKQFGSADFDTWQIQRWQWYDYARYNSAGTNSLQMFINPQGSTDPVSVLPKTLEQTNMPKAGSFGQTYYLLQQVRTHAFILPKARQPAGISDNTLTTWRNMPALTNKFAELLRRGSLSISINQKLYWQFERPFLACPPGFGMNIQEFGASEGATPTAGIDWVQQSPYYKDVWNLNPNPQMFEPEQSFNVTFNWDSLSPVFTTLVNGATPNIDLGVIFDGYIIRPNG